MFLGVVAAGCLGDAIAQQAPDPPAAALWAASTLPLDGALHRATAIASAGAPAPDVRRSRARLGLRLDAEDCIQVEIEEPLGSVVPGAGGTVVRWGPVRGVRFFDAIRETSVVIDLGPVNCVEAGSTDESTLGLADAEVPVPGAGFFYLVEYDDGTSSSYGLESADKPRAPGPGACE